MTIIYLFGKFSDQDIDWMIGAGTRKVVSTGEVLIRAGQSLDSFYITLSGRFEVTAGDRLIASIPPGAAVGELSFLDNQATSATVTATEECVVVAFSVKRLRTKLRLDEHFASRFYHAMCVVLAERIRRATRLIAMAAGPVAGGVVRAPPPPMPGGLDLARMLDQVGVRRRVPADAELLVQGRPADSFYRTRSGWFAVTVGHRLIAHVGPDDVIGELGLLDGLPPAATVTASEDAVVETVAVDELRARLRADRALASKFYLALGVLLAARVRRFGRLVASGNLDDNAVSVRLPIPPMLLDDTALASTRFHDIRRNYLRR